MNYKTSKYWQPYQTRIAKAIHKHGLEKFRSNHEICKGFGDSLPVDPILPRFTSIIPSRFIAPYRKLVITYRKQMLEYRQKALEEQYDWVAPKIFPNTTAFGCEDFIELKGKKISVYYLKIYERIVEANIEWDKINTVVEIGGGFGANVHLLEHFYPHLSFTLIDIYPVLDIARHYLGALGKGPFVYRYPDEVDKMQCDVLWNAYSFQEMTKKQINKYLKLIEHKKLVSFNNEKNFEGELIFSPSRSSP